MVTSLPAFVSGLVKHGAVQLARAGGAGRFGLRRQTAEVMRGQWSCIWDTVQHKHQEHPLPLLPASLSLLSVWKSTPYLRPTAKVLKICPVNRCNYRSPGPEAQQRRSPSQGHPGVLGMLASHASEPPPCPSLGARAGPRDSCGV